MKNKILVFLSILVITLSSCKEEVEVWDSKTADFAGSWWAALYFEDKEQTDMYNIFTYNTAANEPEIWISDEAHLWNFKVKCPVNVSDLSFAGSDLKNESATGDDITINIRNGKILKAAGKSLSGVVVDSIYFEIEFSDDPDIFYNVRGAKQTGFEEDKY